MLKLRGIDSISDAERLVGSEVRIPGSEVPPPVEGAYYTFDLKGCRVYTPTGEWLGAVSGWIETSGTELLVVEHEGGELLIPFAEAFLKSVDVEAKRIVVELPEGLRELNNKRSGNRGQESGKR